VIFFIFFSNINLSAYIADLQKRTKKTWPRRFREV